MATHPPLYERVVLPGLVGMKGYGLFKSANKRTPMKTKAVAKPYEPTERERPALEALKARSRSKPPVPMMKKSESGNGAILPDHPDLKTGTKLLMEALGTTSHEFLGGIVTQLANAGIKGKEIDMGSSNFMLSIAIGIEPKDQIEAMLAAQMAAVHMQTMTFARRLNHVENIPQQDSAERAFNKLARTFTAQMEALNKYRGKGQQKMTVEHVHVHEGGQAIVGNVQGGEGQCKKVGATPCKSDRCITAPGAEQRPGAGHPASLRPCRTGGVGCMVERPPAHRVGRPMETTKPAYGPKRLLLPGEIQRA
jgi:Spy/CpxP family protein refolding chaperone